MQLVQGFPECGRETRRIVSDRGIPQQELQHLGRLDGLEDALSEKAATATYKGTFLAIGWSDAALFTQDITVDSVLSADYPFVDIDLSEVDDATSVIEGWKQVGRCTVSADNTVIAYCYEEAPAVDIPIIFKVVR